MKEQMSNISRYGNSKKESKVNMGMPQYLWGIAFRTPHGYQNLQILNIV